MENYELVSKAVSYIEKQKCSTALNIEDVAREAGFSTDYFNRIFRSHTGYNVMEYVRFRRLVHAAILLRRTQRSVIDIALGCGYDSHDGFTRAFKGQYGKTPNEYRESLIGEPMRFSELQLNATASARIRRVLPEFNTVPLDEAIDYLLKTDSKRFGYDAVCFDINKTVILSDRDIEADGCFIGADMIDSEGAYMYIHVRNLFELKRYVELSMRLSAKVIHICVEETVDENTIRQTLDGISYEELSAIPQTMYLEDNLVKHHESERYTFRPLERSDTTAVDLWLNNMNLDLGWGLGLHEALEFPLDKRPDDQPLGLFDGESLIGVARVSVQEVHGFRINNCIYNAILPEYESDDLYRLMYVSALNYVLSQNGIPFDDIQFGEFAKNNGNFSAADMGFEQVNTAFIVKFK